MIPISSSDEYSWKRSNELLVEVARHGEESGYGVPSLIIAAKDDLDPHPMSVQKSVRVYILSLKPHLCMPNFRNLVPKVKSCNFTCTLPVTCIIFKLCLW